MMTQFENLGLRGVIFDMDGLLFDTEILYVEAWPHVGEAMGFSVTEEVARRMISRSRRECEAMLLDLYGPDFSLTEAYKIMVQRIRPQLETRGVPLKPGARELLQFLHREKVPVGLGTSNSSEVAKAYLGATGLAAYFDALVAGDMVTHAKPAPDIFLRAAAELGLRSEQCLVLEDSSVGVEAAYRAGCLSALVPDLLAPTEEAIGRAWRVFGSLTEVQGTLF